MNDRGNKPEPVANGRNCPGCSSSMLYVGKLPRIGLRPMQFVYRCPTCNQIVREPDEPIAP